MGRAAGGKKVGPWRFYHHDGKTLKATGRFEKGEQSGPWKRWYGGTTQLCDVGRYDAGRRRGEWRFYDRTGSLRPTQVFR